MPLPEELEFELEALRATYDEVEVEILEQNCDSSSSGGPALSPLAAVSVPVLPRTDGASSFSLGAASLTGRDVAAAAAASQDQYVAARLVLRVGPAYPTEPPAVQLADARGLGDARLAGLQAALAAEAVALAGELSLGHLVETALDLLTAANQPEGHCVFCLEPLLPAGAEASAAGREAEGHLLTLPLLRLGCYHVYHVACFAPWWQWQQRQLAEREAQLREEYKSMAPLKLEEEGILLEAAPGSTSGEHSCGGNGAGGAVAAAFVLSCPACRMAVPPSSLAHLWDQLQAMTAESWSGGSGSSAGSAAARGALHSLPEQQRRALAAMQQWHAAVKKRQAACGGLVDATHSVSLSDLQQAASAAAETAAAAAAAAAAEAEQQHPQRLQQEASGRGRAGSGRRGGPHPHPPRSGRGPSSAGRHAAGSGRGRGRQGPAAAKHAQCGAGAPLEAAVAGLHLHSNGQQQVQQQQQQGRQPARPHPAVPHEEVRQQQAYWQDAPPQQGQKPHLPQRQQQQQQQSAPGHQQAAPEQQQRQQQSRSQRGGGGRHRAGGSGSGRGSRVPHGAAPAAA